jgi:hypothetical protein
MRSRERRSTENTQASQQVVSVAGVEQILCCVFEIVDGRRVAPNSERGTSVLSQFRPYLGVRESAPGAISARRTLRLIGLRYGAETLDMRIGAAAGLQCIEHHFFAEDVTGIPK